jgi:hypothetical protein
VTQAAWPSVEEVDAIAASRDPIQRNFSITAAYGRLSHAFATWLPGGANWCAFATWASKQAGRTIRKEDLANAVAERLSERLADRPILREAEKALGLTPDHVGRVVGEVSRGLPGIDRASNAVARGNLKVFAEIGREFARFLATAAAGAESANVAFAGGLRAGPPPDGQDLLRLAFTNYADARSTAAPWPRAQLMLLANVRIGLHEQTRLQPEIREAMDAALLDVADTRRRVLERLDHVVGEVAGVLHTGVGRRIVNALADHISDELRSIARIVITDRLMTIGLPRGGSLRLGTDVVGAFPPPLATLTNTDLVATLADYDAAADSLRGSGAVDWADLAQRMHFIADFFRAYHLDATLFDAPFGAGRP